MTQHTLRSACQGDARAVLQACHAQVVTNQSIGPQRTDTRLPCYKGKQVQDVSLWFPYWHRPRQTAGNSCGHSLIQVPECGNKFNQAWESCTTIGQSGDCITHEKWYNFQGN